MALTMSDATYARSESGKKQLINDLCGDIKKVSVALKSSSTDFRTLENTIKNSWSGEDAIRYVERLKTKVDVLASDIAKYSKIIEETINQDFNDFAKFQQHNASGMKL